jgi:hypothetical protein
MSLMSLHVDGNWCKQFMFLNVPVLLSIHDRFLVCGIPALTRKNAMRAVHRSFWKIAKPSVK